MGQQPKETLFTAAAGGCVMHTERATATAVSDNDATC